MGCDPPHQFAFFIARQEIDNLCELEDGIGGAEEFLTFVEQGGHKKGILLVKPKRETDKGI
jgi:hypothetical protein